jgi:hypothetical protein
LFKLSRINLELGGLKIRRFYPGYESVLDHDSVQSIMGKFELAPASSVSRTDISWVGMWWFEQDSHAGDAVVIAPVSGQIPC